RTSRSASERASSAPSLGCASTACSDPRTPAHKVAIRSASGTDRYLLAAVTGGSAGEIRREKSGMQTACGRLWTSRNGVITEIHWRPPMTEATPEVTPPEVEALHLPLLPLNTGVVL